MAVSSVLASFTIIGVGMKDDKPLQLQRRWTKERTARAMTGLTRTPPDLESLKSIFGEISLEGQSDAEYEMVRCEEEGRDDGCGPRGRPLV
jgi:hypothetical protein